MDLSIQNSAGKSTGSISVSDAVFACEFNEALVHQVVVAYLAGGRAGTKAQKNRSDVRGGGRKPFNQKGSGRARAGTIRSPLWRSGGTTFAARPQDHSQKVNRKMYRAAVRSILSELARQDRLIVVDSLGVDAPKTKQLVATLAGLNAKHVLIVTEEQDSNLDLASRNLYRVDTRTINDVDPVGLVGYEKVIMTEGALRKMEARLA